LDFIEENEVDGVNVTPVPFELCSKSSETEFSNANGFKDYNMYCFNGTKLANKTLEGNRFKGN